MRLAGSCPQKRLGVACRPLEDGRKCRPPWADNPSRQMCQDPHSCLGSEPHARLHSPLELLISVGGLKGLLCLWTQRVPTG